ncbi:aminotransferase class IV (plasmid) [Streptomyces sp. NBC_01724]|uniref:aminotransferase class IV n=1 Tax=unclassified Streptomyces TaxID=2593676 RepID=UPI002E34125D|nr:aminotransferase class IV [Streptomyces sp. NBC_01724]
MTELDGRPVDLASLQKLALVGYGHFTSMRIDDLRVRGLTLHLERLVRDCKIVFGEDLSPERVLDHVRRAVNGMKRSMVARVTVFDPGLDMGRPADNGQPGILVTIRGAGAIPPPPLRVQPVQYERDLPQVKHIGLFGALHGRRQAQLAGADDALFHSADGMISEGGTWNVGFILNGQVVWPEADVLPGVTMALLQQSAHQHVIRPVSLDEARAAEAAFATNTTIGVRAISVIGDTELAADHPLLRELQEAYLADEGELL